jgi:hypothetical protein
MIVAQPSSISTLPCRSPENVWQVALQTAM